MTSVELGIEDLAKYPFLEEAGKYIKARDLSLEDIAQPDFNMVIERARKRVLQAIRNREVSNEIGTPEIELLSFPLALMLIKATNLDHLISRYSYSEAVRAEKFLESEREELVVQIFRNTLKIDVTPIETNTCYPVFNYKIPIMDYLKRAISFHELEWKLVNRSVDQGYVYLRSHELIRLIRQEVENMIRERLKILTVSKLPDSLKKTIQDISIRSPAPNLSYRVRITPDKYPPCVATALSMLNKRENLPHYGRFLFTTYLVNIGSSVEEILALYSGSPDFNERITKYQIEHIAGLRGGRVKYNCPSCRTLVTHSFCFKTKECDDIQNPLQFGRKIVPNVRKQVNKKWTKKQLKH